jgi:hypothetical protein
VTPSPELARGEKKGRAAVVRGGFGRSFELSSMGTPEALRDRESGASLRGDE